MESHLWAILGTKRGRMAFSASFLTLQQQEIHAHYSMIAHNLSQTTNTWLATQTDTVFSYKMILIYPLPPTQLFTFSKPKQKDNVLQMCRIHRARGLCPPQPPPPPPPPPSLQHRVLSTAYVRTVNTSKSL